jgi:hypothetical protein
MYSDIVGRPLHGREFGLRVEIVTTPGAAFFAVPGPPQSTFKTGLLHETKPDARMSVRLKVPLS